MSFQNNPLHSCKYSFSHNVRNNLVCLARRGLLLGNNVVTTFPKQGKEKTLKWFLFPLFWYIRALGKNAHWYNVRIFVILPVFLWFCACSKQHMSHLCTFVIKMPHLCTFIAKMLHLRALVCISALKMPTILLKDAWNDIMKIFRGEELRKHRVSTLLVILLRWVSLWSLLCPYFYVCRTIRVDTLPRCFYWNGHWTLSTAEISIRIKSDVKLILIVA